MTVRRVLISALAMSVLLVAACRATFPKYNYKGEPDPRTSEWVLGVGDSLSINVWENPGLGTEATIRPDGTITMPLVGDLHAAGETPTALKAMIKARLTDFVKLASGSEITVAVRGANSYRFTIVGEVTRPGVVQLGYYVTVVEAIAMAGGFTRFANSNGMLVLRRDPKTGVSRSIPIVYQFIVDGSHPESNLVLLSGDTVVVP